MRIYWVVEVAIGNDIKDRMDHEGKWDGLPGSRLRMFTDMEVIVSAVFDMSVTKLM